MEGDDNGNGGEVQVYKITCDNIPNVKDRQPQTIKNK